MPLAWCPLPVAGDRDGRQVQGEPSQGCTAAVRRIGILTGGCSQRLCFKEVHGFLPWDLPGPS